MALKVPIPKLWLKKRKVEEIKFSAECKLPYHDEEEPWYLKEYIAQVREKRGEPDFVDKVPSEYKFKRRFNVIYPVGGGIFIHALSERTEGGYARYIVIEPPRPPEEILRKAEELIAAKIPEGYIPKSPQEKACMLLELVKSSFASIGGSNGGKKRLAFGKRGSSNGNGSKEAIKYVRPEELLNAVIYHIVRDKISVGLLEPFIRDPYIEDISCSGLGNIFIIHKIFGPMESNIRFESHDELNAYLIALAEKIGKPLSNARPIVDATLPDGSRINIVYGTDVSLRGSNFTIRKVSKTPLSVTQLINWGTFDARVAAYMWILLREGMSGFICGETASGKTTSLTAMLVFIRPSAKIVSIEDTAEVIVPHPNWTRELTRDTGKPESSVTMFDLLKAALRQRPNYIIVGEIRGAEGNIAFQAMQTGHPVLSTFHAADIDRLIQRLTNHPINVPKTNMDSLNFAWFQSAVYTKQGFLARRLIKLYELLGYDPSTDSILAVPVFVWDPSTDRFIFSGRGASYLLEEKIAVMKGIPRSRIKEIYDELELRRAFLEEMVRRKIFNYWDVWKAIVKADELGVEEALRRLRAGTLL